MTSAGGSRSSPTDKVGGQAPAAPLMLSVSGCRGIFGKTMTPEVASRYALVLAGELRSAHAARSRVGRPCVVLARDGRAAGELLASAAASGLAAGGCDVLDLGVSMTPTVGVMVDRVGAAGGLVITASHNPQNWNGLKPMFRDASLAPGRTSASAPAKRDVAGLIEKYRAIEHFGAAGVDVQDVGAITIASRGGGLVPSAGTSAHLEKLRAAMNAMGLADDRRGQGLSCIVDSVNSSGVEGAQALLGGRLKHHLGSSDNGLFPHVPEPTRENLTGLAEFVRAKRVDVGFAQDPDADRLAIIDERGNYIGEEYTLVLAAEAILSAVGESARGRSICVNLSTSRMIEDVAAKYGARVVRTPVGEAHVVEAMKSTNAIFGGEGNGGVIWPEVTFIRDSLSGMALVLSLLARTGNRVSELVSDVPSYAIVKRKVDLSEQSQAARAASAVWARFKEHTIDQQDGVWVGFAQERAWLHVRGSNTEPIMRIIAEAPTRETAERLLDEAARAIEQG
jgi:phosphomannomutase